MTQFPLRLAWATTGHKVQGVTIKKGTNVVLHGHKRMPYSLMYVMLSRAEKQENVFLEKFDPSQIRVDPMALEEDSKLDARSIVPSYHKMHFNFFVLNTRSLVKHFTDIKIDMYAQKSDHICVTETWIESDNIVDFALPGRVFHHASKGKGKGCGIFSVKSKSGTPEKIVEDNFQILSIFDGPIQLILLYLSSDSSKAYVVEKLEMILQPDHFPIITGDFNFDKEEKNCLTKYLRSKEFEQLVTAPTHDDGRTIDHCYVPQDMKNKFQLVHHSPYFSDHDALCIKFEN